ncbi:MAG TPA: TIM barrel protein, partial [Candidatus Avimonas sp.]|nr:TIM barrel protein [Candidatus Avimonas sp.]
VGVCWDFGHANLAANDQNESLKLIGKRLKATHVNDNDKLKDRHLLPFYGVIEWEPIMKTLKEIDYQGDFTFEITPFLDRVPPVIRQKALEHTVEVGNYLISLAK